MFQEFTMELPKKNPKEYQWIAVEVSKKKSKKNYQTNSNSSTEENVILTEWIPKEIVETIPKRSSNATPKAIDDGFPKK